MAEIEDLINELPLTIFKEKEHLCSCGNKYIKKHKYSLKIKLLAHYNCNYKPAHRYLTYYKCSDFSSGDQDRYIGIAVGFGKVTLYEALKELKTYVNNKIDEVLNDRN